MVNGLFSVNLGDSPQPTFPETIFTDDTRYLGITVDGAELAERKRLVSVPYALNASSGIPHGVIVMWSGSQASIPTGWALCDGQNGTPNLKDRFVIAAGNTYAIGSNGGSATKNLSHTHTTGNHALTIAEMPSHTHVQDPHRHAYSNGSDTTSSGYAANTNNGSPTQYTEYTTANNQNTGGGAAHNHGPTGAAGSASQDIMPPYYALAFIMKL